MYQEYTGNQRGYNSLVTDMNGIHKKLCTLLDLISNPKKEYDYEIVCLSNDGGLNIVSGYKVFDNSTDSSLGTTYLGDGSVAIGYSQVLCNSNLKKVDFELGCSSVDSRILVRVYIQDNAGIITSQVFEQDGVTPVTDGSILVKCSPNTKYDYEETLICVDGKTWTKTKVYDIVEGIPNLITILWFNELDTLVSAPAQSLIDNVNCVPPCQPKISYAFGNDLSTLLPGNTISIENKNCCSVKVITDAGEFIVFGDSGKMTEKFDCLVTVNSVELLQGSKCSLDKVLITSYKVK